MLNIISTITFVINYRQKMETKIINTLKLNKFSQFKNNKIVAIYTIDSNNYSHCFLIIMPLIFI